MTGVPGSHEGTTASRRAARTGVMDPPPFGAGAMDRPTGVGRVMTGRKAASRVRASLGSGRHRIRTFESGASSARAPLEPLGPRSPCPLRHPARRGRAARQPQGHRADRRSFRCDVPAARDGTTRDQHGTDASQQTGASGRTGGRSRRDAAHAARDLAVSCSSPPALSAGPPTP